MDNQNTTEQRPPHKPIGRPRPSLDRAIPPGLIEGKAETVTKKQEEPMEQATEIKEQYRPIAIELIKTDNNIRQHYDEKHIQELAASMKTEGQLQPIRVYKKTDDEYIIITGHRRYKAAQEAKIANLNCIVCDKPKTDIDRLYTQAIENEQRENISVADRETYITALIKAEQSQKDICEKMGKSPAWISQTVKAKEGRDQFGSKFTEAGIELDTYAAYQLAGATEEAVDKAVEALKENPTNKKAILKELAQSKKQTTTRGRPRKTEQPVQTYVMGYRITINEDDKSVTIGANDETNELIRGFYDQHGNEFTDLTKKYFQDKGYRIQ